VADAFDRGKEIRHGSEADAALPETAPGHDFRLQFVVLTENARRRKLKRWLLLSLRMACLALLAALFARPFLLARDQAGKERLVAILIDRSASMQLKERGKRLIDLAVDAARDVINQSGDKTQIDVAFFDQAARPVGGGAKESTGDAKSAKSAKELGTEVKIDGTEYLIMREEDVLAIVG
jgi:hypothetical protein